MSWSAGARCGNNEDETKNNGLENNIGQDNSPSEDFVAANVAVVSEQTCDLSINEEETLPLENIEDLDQQDLETLNVVGKSEINCAFTQNASVKTEEDKVDIIHSVVNEETAIPVDDNVELAKVESCNETIVCETPRLIEVYATAIFDKSPTQYLTQEEFESLGRFVTNLEHLQRNVQNIVVDSYSTRNIGDGSFMHTANVRIHVKSEHLWESGRSYLWKHLGQDTWGQGNGTCITLKRIHQKI